MEAHFGFGPGKVSWNFINNGFSVKKKTWGWLFSLAQNHSHAPIKVGTHLGTCCRDTLLAKKFWAILIIRQEVFKHPKVWTSKLLTAQNICARGLNFLYGANSSWDTKETHLLDRLWYYVIRISVKTSVCMKTLFSIPVDSVYYFCLVGTNLLKCTSNIFVDN